MSDSSWVLKGIDAETRQHAAEEAERRGMSLADYLTDVVLQNALAADIAAQTGAEPEAEDSAETMSFVPPVPDREGNFAVRHRLEALERRLGLAVGGLDSAVHALDSSVFGLAARVDEHEALGKNTVYALNHGLADLHTALKALRSDVADTETDLDALATANAEAHAGFEAKHTEFDRRLASVDEIARAAERTGADLVTGQHAFRRTVADDIAAFTQDCTNRVSQELEELRAASEEAAEQAEAAAQRFATDIRMLRENLSQQLADYATETDARIRTSIAESGELYAALTERVNDSERATQRATEQVRIRLMDVEDGANAALETATASLQQEQAVLSAEIAGVRHDAGAALAAVRAELAADAADLRERQQAALARLKLVDAATSNTITDLATFRDDVDRRFAGADERTDRVHKAVSSDVERVEASTIAALTKLAAEREAGDAAAALALTDTRHALASDIAHVRAALTENVADVRTTLTKDVADVRTTLTEDVAQVRTTLAAAIAETRQTLSATLAETRDQAAGALARLKLIDQALGAQGMIAACEAGAPSAAERLTRLESELASRLTWIESELPARLTRLEAELPQRLAHFSETRALDAAAITQLQAAAERTTHDLARLAAASEGDRTSATQLQNQTAQLQGQIAALSAQLAQLMAQQEAEAATLTGVSLQLEEHAQQLARRVDDGVIARMDDLKARLSVQESQVSEAADRVHGIARMLGRVTAQNADVSTQSEERLHRLELALADLRLERISNPGEPSSATEAPDVAARLGEIEQHLANAVLELRDEVALHIGKNERRISALEKVDATDALTGRLAQIEQLLANAVLELRNEVAAVVGDNERRIAALEAGGDAEAADRLGLAFDELRRRVEERVVQIESRTIRSLDQVMESVAMLSRKFANGEDLVGPAAQSA